MSRSSVKLAAGCGALSVGLTACVLLLLPLFGQPRSRGAVILVNSTDVSVRSVSVSFPHRSTESLRLGDLSSGEMRPLDLPSLDSGEDSLHVLLEFEAEGAPRVFDLFLLARADGWITIVEKGRGLVVSSDGPGSLHFPSGFSGALELAPVGSPSRGSSPAKGR